MKSRFDAAVIGNGMMGASAARHLSKMGLSIAAVGPAEPVDWQLHNGVFASYYDEARITRTVDPDPVWSKLAARSIAVYGEIEERTGIIFHHRAGCLRVSPLTDRVDDMLDQSARNGDDNGAEYVSLSPEELQQRFPYLCFHPQSRAYLEGGGAGYVNPRALVAAQLQMACSAGAALVQETAVSLSGAGDAVQITTDAGTQIVADRVLLATGGFTNHLLPHPLDLHPRIVSILLAELEGNALASVNAMPSIIYRLADDPVLYSIYSLPPVRYPDGKTYFKIGGQLLTPQHLYSREELVEWFLGDGSAKEVEALKRVLTELIPDLNASSYHSKPCIVTHTAHDRPYIDGLDMEFADGSATAGRLFVAAGGCGGAAKSSVEIGRLAARLVAAGRWDDDLPAEWFQAA